MDKIELVNCTKTYLKDNKSIKALNKVNYKFCKNKFYVIMGDSGSGKSTLINVLSGIISVDEGQVLYDNENITTNNRFAEIRNENVGLVYQSFLLNDNMTALENVLLPTFINKNLKKKDALEKAKDLIKSVGLENRMNHYPRELSGGEQQRFSICRALINDPDVILADEPTGSLDKKNEDYIFKLLSKLAKEEGKCVIVVSHNPSIKKYADIIVKMEKGKLYEDK